MSRLVRPENSTSRNTYIWLSCSCPNRCPLWCGRTSGSTSLRPSHESAAKSFILTIVDHFSKYYHFIPLAHPYLAESVVQVFFTEVIRLHGVPQSLVSVRHPVFTSLFWKELMGLSRTKLHMTSAFHPQSDGQTEAANKVIVMYLRCLATVGGVQLQHSLPDCPQGYAVPDHLRPRPTFHPSASKSSQDLNT